MSDPLALDRDSAADQAEIDAIANEFEAELKTGASPEVSIYAGRAKGNLREKTKAVLTELRDAYSRSFAIKGRLGGKNRDVNWETVGKDLRASIARGGMANGGAIDLLKDYYLAFPDKLALTDIDFALLKVEIELRFRAGHEPSVEEYESDYPHLRSQIREAFVDTVAADAATTGFVSDSPRPESVSCQPSIDPQVGDLVGKYKLLKEIGEGGMGKVFVAEHQDMGCERALKIILPHIIEGTQARDRFNREMRLLAKIDHPNIVRAHDSNAGQDGSTPYLAMELVSGPSLRELIDRDGPLTVQVACRYISDVARGLGSAHELKLIHRDVKPHNLLLSKDQTVKIVDFGLARRQTSGSTLETDSADASISLTTGFQCLGTPDYAAPEQCLPNQEIGHKADFYGLGCTLYFLLMGRPPFDTEEYGSAPAKLQAQVAVPPPLLTSARGDRIPSQLQKLYQDLMAKSPRDRPETGAEIVERLRPFVEEPIGKRSAFNRGWRIAARVAGLAAVCWFGIPLLYSGMRNLAGARNVTEQSYEKGREGNGTSGSENTASRTSTLSRQDIEDRALVGFDIQIEERAGTDEAGNAVLGNRKSPAVGDAHKEDAARISLQFKRPSYCYLVALNPTDDAEMSVQLCTPEPKVPDGNGGTIAPQPVIALKFPEDAGSRFFLNDGVGLQVFIVIYSDMPLPTYTEFLKLHPGLLEWSRYAGSGVWNYHDGKFVDGFGAREMRGSVESIAPPELDRLLDSAVEALQGTGIHLAARAFPVLPATSKDSQPQ